MTLDWILGVGTVIFAITTWATLNFGYAYFRELGRRDDLDAAGRTDGAADAAGGASAAADVADAADAVPDVVPERVIPGA
jgi:hypothetical protein